MRLLVVGGGISGLSAGLFANLRHPQLEVTVLEGSDAPGGMLRSVLEGGHRFEFGPLTLPHHPVVLDLVRSLGLEAQLATPARGSEGRALWLAGGRVPWPADPLRLWQSPHLSRAARLRLLRGWFAPRGFRRGMTGDESVEHFLARHLGDEAAAHLAEAAVFEVSAGNPAKLSVDALFPRWRQLEARHGSWLRGLRRALRSDRAAPPASGFAGGMQTLVGAATRALGGRLRTQVEVVALRRTAEGVVAVDSRGETWGADAVLLTLPAPDVARLLAPEVPAAAAQLAAIPYAPLVVAGLGYARSDVPTSLTRGHLYLPRGAGGPVRLIQATSAAFPTHAPPGGVTLRVLAGGTFDPTLHERGDEELLAALRADLAASVGLVATPAAWSLQRWPRALPQYTLGHRARLAVARRALADGWPEVAFGGAFVSGSGLADALLSARGAVARLLGPARV
jgi:protoporphyrinogen/coproporphyrinogen III oxidase